MLENIHSKSDAGKDVSNSSKCRSFVVFKVPCFASARVRTTMGKGQPVNRHAPADATRTIHILYDNNMFTGKKETQQGSGPLTEIHLTHVQNGHATMLLIKY